MEIALAKLAEILMEKMKEQSSLKRSQRERVEEEHNYGRYKPIPSREYVGKRESLVLNRLMFQITNISDFDRLHNFLYDRQSGERKRK